MTTLTIENTTQLFQSLLQASGWKHDRDSLIEAFPHFSLRLQPRDIAQTLDSLGIPFAQIRCRMHEITASDCPALVLPDHELAFLALNGKGAHVLVDDIKAENPRFQKLPRHRCTLFRIDRFAYDHSAKTQITVSQAFRDLRPILPGLLFVSMLSNVLGLFAPLLVMAVYDRIIPSGSVDMLLSLAVGIAVVAATDMGFRHMRTRALTYIGWRGEKKLMTALFRKLMSLPMGQMQSSDANQHLSRFRQFEALREMFTGQMITTLLDLPFALLFLAVLLYFAPSVGLWTLGLAVALAIVGLITIPRQKQLEKKAAQDAALSQLAVQDAIVHQGAFASLGMQTRWLQRCMPLIETGEESTKRARQFQALAQSLGQTLGGLATTGAITLCAHAAMSGTLSFGALIASIALVSKIFGPLQALYSGFPQLLSFQASREQADRVLSLPQEMELGLGWSHQKALNGSISFSSVTHRPDPLRPPLLSQVSLTFNPGEVVVVLSSDTAARTAVLDLIDGLASPIGGTIEHDAIDIRQIARDELRKSITYATYEKSLFYGTVAQNFRLAAPSLSDMEIQASLDKMGLRQGHNILPNGVKTRLSDEALSQMPDEILKSLTLARSMARPASVYLFSEPTNGLNDTRRQAFKTWVKDQAGNRTVIIATADRSFLNIADRFIYLNAGQVAVNDTGEVGRKKILAALKTLGA
jgi:ATP-binding cassette subfamily C protein/ATP-binding cassette subfamily C protein LapB